MLDAFSTLIAAIFLPLLSLSAPLYAYEYAHTATNGRDLNIVIVRATSIRYRRPLLRVCNTRGGENSRVDPRKIPRYRPTQRFNEGNVLFREEHKNRGYCNRGRFDLRFRGLSIKGNNRERNIGCPRARIVSRFKITLLAIPNGTKIVRARLIIAIDQWI